MTEVLFPYGKRKLSYQFRDDELAGILTSSMEEYIPAASGQDLVKAAMEEPIGTPKLRDLAKDKQTVVIIASDHTRPVPSKIIMPFMLEEIRAGNPDADITILIATGCHRGTTREELVQKFGEDIVAKE